MKTLQVILDDDLVVTVAIILPRIDAFDLPSRSQAVGRRWDTGK